jgi:predicted DNA-binding transcriptional regulator AlpA
VHVNEAVNDMRSELESALTAARSLSPEELPRFIGELEEVRTTALIRLTAPVIHPQVSDSLLSIVEAAATLGMSKSYLYRNADKFSFVRREGRALRFSARGVQEYLSGRRRR